MKILFATNNEAKIDRFKKLLASVDLDVELVSPIEIGVDVLDVEETGDTLEENAEIKARAYFGMVDIPILAHDSGLYVEDEGLFTAPKRVALCGISENDLTKEEISEKVISYWKDVATKHGGKVDGAWVDAFALINPDGSVEKSDSRREIIITNQEFGKSHLQMPMRAIYCSKTTNKPAVLHNEEEEILELKPIVSALVKVFKK